MSGLTIPLPDGSVATVESTGDRSSLISRSVDGECVWGQCFSSGADHRGQVRDVIDDMATRPGDFVRWWDREGRA